MDRQEPWEVLIAEPDEYQLQLQAFDLVRDGGFRVTAERGAASAATLANRRKFDFAIVNAVLPDGSSTTVIRAVLAKNPDAHVLVATDACDENLVMRAIAAGADGYVLFSDVRSSPASCLRVMLSGGSPVSPQVARYVLRSLHARQGSLRQAVESPLSTREQDVLLLLAKGLSFAQIGAILAISTNTVTTHIKKIYCKLHVHSRGEAVYEARQMKLID